MVVWTQAAEGEGDPRDGARDVRAGPLPCKKIHPQSGEIEMGNAENVQRPGQREKEVEQAAGIKHHRVPLGGKGNPGIAQRIPQGDFTGPKSLPVIVGERIAEDAEVPQDEGLIPEDDRKK